MAMNMKWIIHKDGSFDLVTRYGTLRNACPGMDHQTIRCSKVGIKDQTITYHLAEGTIEVKLDQCDDGLSLHCELRGVKSAPHWMHPLHGARLDRFTGFFRQGVGFSGPTGHIDLSAGIDLWSYESYLLAAFTAGENSLVMAPFEHRDYQFKAQVYNRLFRANFRNREVEDSVPMVEAGFRTERIAVKDSLVLPTVYFAEGEGLFDTLRAAMGFVARANEVKFHDKPRYHYCSAYYHSQNFTRALLDNLLEGLKRDDPQHHLQTVQIDDWYMTSHGDWLTFKGHLWPGGLKPAFEAIAKAGYVPGVWVAPFMVGCSSKLAAEHPDWLLRDLDGSLVTEWKHYRGAASPDFEHYVLDTSHPDAAVWVREVFGTFRSWGVRFFKTDFLEWGYRDSTKYRHHAPGRTGAQYFDDAMALIREAIGADSYWLGCITYFAPSVGYMDGMRMTSDVGNTWAAVGGIGNDGVAGGIPNMIEESYATLYMNNVFWQNDPDVVFIRDRHTHLTEPEFRSLAAWHALLGHSVNTSAQFGELSQERLTWWRWMRPQETPWTARLPYFGREHPFRVAVRDYAKANGRAVLILNDRPDKGFAVMPLRELTGQKRAAVYRWGPDGSEPVGRRDKLSVELDPHHSLLLFVSRDGKPAPDNLNLGGSFSTE